MVNILEMAFLHSIMDDPEFQNMQQEDEAEEIQIAMQQKLILEGLRFKDGIYRTDH